MDDRIKQIRQNPKIDMSQEAFGKRLGLTGAAISRMENGQRIPSNHVILAICREFNVNEHWLRTGEGEMFVETAEDSLHAIMREYGLDETDYNMLAAFVELSSAERKAVIGYMRRVVERVNRMEAEKRNPAAPEPKNVHDWTEEEMDAEYQRQKKAERADREKGTGESSTGSPNVSGAATA